MAMNASFPDHDTIHAVLSLATMAPSVHNSQPWRWRVGARSLHLYADQRLQLPYTDPDLRDLVLSCGACLHHAVVALAALGWQAKIHRLPNPAEPNHLAAVTVSRHPGSDVDVALASAIPLRRTDRRHYSPRRVPRDYITLMGARAARAGVMLRQVEGLPKLERIVAQAAAKHASNYGYLTELTAWSGRHGSLVGVPARNAPQPDPTAAIPSRVFSGAMLAQPPHAGAADDHAAVLALGTEDDSRLARLRAGEATSLVLLTATALELASCPITEPLEIVETRDAVKIDVFGASGFPQMLLRIGWAPIDADPLPATPRRPVADVTQWLDGAAFHDIPPLP